ncbi:hypothetical protein OGAPHI_000295 [Ogataea philodendri]|uniref:Uncharacterized protein n=1 Tax=Ogataea philodendri TaxID=1378263 RepID=A0A9P8PHX4_9ASCO|nr:uncharacterized protein OGAPHI_000295 [Ogataea philodendri]KAH3671592.1 hypothetical protein OGAPHI_000295 [Ogataea philodendri]
MTWTWVTLGNSATPLQRRTNNAVLVMRFLPDSSGTFSLPSPSYDNKQLAESVVERLESTATSRVRKRSRPIPSTSNPGPILAEEAGTRMINLSILKENFSTCKRNTNDGGRKRVTFKRGNRY